MFSTFTTSQKIHYYRHFVSLKKSFLFSYCVGFDFCKTYAVTRLSNSETNHDHKILIYHIKNDLWSFTLQKPKLNYSRILNKGLNIKNYILYYKKCLGRFAVIDIIIREPRYPHQVSAKAKAMHPFKIIRYYWVYFYSQRSQYIRW